MDTNLSNGKSKIQFNTIPSIISGNIDKRFRKDLLYKCKITSNSIIVIVNVNQFFSLLSGIKTLHFFFHFPETMSISCGNLEKKLGYYSKLEPENIPMTVFFRDGGENEFNAAEKSDFEIAKNKSEFWNIKSIKSQDIFFDKEKKFRIIYVFEQNLPINFTEEHAKKKNSHGQSPLPYLESGHKSFLSSYYEDQILQLKGSSTVQVFINRDKFSNFEKSFDLFFNFENLLNFLRENKKNTASPHNKENWEKKNTLFQGIVTYKKLFMRETFYDIKMENTLESYLQPYSDNLHYILIKGQLKDTQSTRRINLNLQYVFL